ncbi:MAG: isoleucine--tRNA ligase [Phycisphaerae bacterium]|nr:isoleucine--tRNA ligase [Tepidisphaeraceae bacterium]
MAENQPDKSEQKAQKNVYKETLNLPQTAFAMEAKLVQNEPARLKRWQEGRLYDRVLAARARSPKGSWVLHDGPPFANGDIHIGHLINKTLKDVILRFRSMEGYRTPYVPGWDCHGLPIEHKIQEELKKKGKNIREMAPVDVRRECFAYAQKYATVQSEQFQRLGILGDWANPYLTMAPEYEASTLEVFAQFVAAGLVYKQLKPVPWSVASQTALADAELEYEEVEDPSVYVKFEAVDPSRVYSLFTGGMGKSNLPVHFLVWTTTPWTLPANLAVAVHPEVEYALVAYEGKAVILASDLVKAVFAHRADVKPDVMAVTTGKHLLGLQYRHPFVERVSRVVPAEYVTTTDGTGLVHTAPGHGEEDYETGVREGLECYSPVLASGKFDDTVPEFLRGKSVWEGNGLITQALKDAGKLFAEVKIRHSYPHDWRSKKPIIFRATEQWFVSVEKSYDVDAKAEGAMPPAVPGPVGTTRAELISEGLDGLDAAASTPTETLSLRGRAKDVVTREINFVPAWGKARLLGMVGSRPDWCVSRQRAWGLPIPVFYNDAGEPLLTKESVLAVSRAFRKHGSDAWFTLSPAELLEGHDPGPKFPKESLRKEQDIFDVWFESGSSWHAVLQKREQLKFPADLYLEGSDQHRGWFQLSLLPSLGYTGRSPFEAVLTHGFIVKPDGKKVSKSDKEYVTATQEVERHGADLLRLWCCSVDYQYDVPTSPQVIKDFGDKYRKVRNTVRYLLSNLYDFDPAKHAVEVPPNSLDGWALAQLDELIVGVRGAYDRYELHYAFRLLYDFCSVQFSSLYGNAMKDRMYCDAVDSPLRRRAQTVMHRTVVALVKLLAPMVVFTADEAWEHIVHKPAGEEHLASVHEALLPEPSGVEVSEDQRAEWVQLMELRSQALTQLDRLTREVKTNEGVGYKALDAEIIFYVEDEPTRRKLQAYGVDLADMVGAGFHSFAEKQDVAGPAVTVKLVDRRATYKACARSWKRRPDVGADDKYPDVTLRDALALKAR